MRSWHLFKNDIATGRTRALLLLRYTCRAESKQFFLFLYALSVPAKITFSKKYTERCSHEELLHKAYLTF